MSEEGKSKVFFGLFFGLIIVIIIGGTFILNYHPKDEKNKDLDSYNKMKKLQDKDFIYFDDVEVLSVEQELFYKKPVINFDNEKINELNQKLSDASSRIKGNVVKLDSVSDEQKSSCLYLDDNIYSAKTRAYDIVNYGKYISLVVKEYTYLCTGVFDNVSFESYTFDKSTGEYLSQSDVLKIKGMLFSKIQSTVRSYLEENTTKFGEEVIIDIDNTVNNLNNNASIYIDKDGKLVVLFIVKTDNTDYNDSIEID